MDGSRQLPYLLERTSNSNKSDSDAFKCLGWLQLFPPIGKTFSSTYSTRAICRVGAMRKMWQLINTVLISEYWVQHVWSSRRHLHESRVHAVALTKSPAKQGYLSRLIVALCNGRTRFLTTAIWGNHMQTAFYSTNYKLRQRELKTMSPPVEHDAWSVATVA